MKKFIFFIALVILFISTSFAHAQAVYPYRWVYVDRSLKVDRHVDEIRDIVKTASEHGLNGMVLSTQLDRLELHSPAYFRRLKEVKAICDEYQVEIIPIIFSVGYGSSVLAHDPNLAAGFPVNDAQFVVEDGELVLAPDPTVNVLNGDLEAHKDKRIEKFSFHDKPGEMSFIDTHITKSGNASLRFENFNKHPNGNARLMQEIPVKAHRLYTVSCWVKIEDLMPEDCFAIQVFSKDGRNLTPVKIDVSPTTEWQKISINFNSLHYDTVRVYCGAWKAISGKFWIDDIAIQEVQPKNILIRPGTPITVKSEIGTVYQEGRDYQIDQNPNSPFTIKILPESRIQENDKLSVSYYHSMVINKRQVCICMSEPKVYDIWAREAELIHKHLAPDKYFLGMDEIRSGGLCEACKARNMSMAQMLGDCITRQYNLIHEVNPDAEIFVWSDMLDPNHNARKDYYLIEGDFTGSWNYIPKDIGIVCWYYKKRYESLAHFSENGFKTIAGAYYDGDDLSNPKGWLEALEKTPGAMGIMYTSWKNKYELLDEFGDVISGKKQ